MKALSTLLIAVMVFTSVPVFACGGSCGGDGDKDKDDKVIVQDTQILCDSGGEKTEAEAMCSSCGCKKKECDKPKTEPKPESEATNLCGGSCGGGEKDKDKD